MTSQLCLNLYCLALSGKAYCWQTQDQDRRYGWKVPGVLARKTWLCYSYLKLLWLPRGCFVLWIAFYFSLVISLTLFTTSSGVSPSFFFPLLLLRCVTQCHPLPEVARHLVLSCFSTFCLLPFDFCFLLFPVIFHFVMMFMSCLCHIQYNGIALYCPLLC